MQTRLRAGIDAQVMPGLPVRVRAEPNTQAAITGELPPETEFTVVQGPTCDEEGYLWWLVDANGFTGYVAEGRDGEYFVQPAPGAPLLGDYPLVAADNAAQIVPVSNLQGNLGDYLAFTPDSAYLVTVGEPGSEAAWIYTLADLEAGVRTINAGSTLTDIDFGPEPRLALFGSGNGGVRLWNITPDATLVERAFLLGHDSPVSAVAFAPDGQTFASTGGLAFMRVDDPGNQFGIIVWTLENVAQRAALRGHTAEVTEMHYDPADATGTSLVSSSADGTLRFWSVAAQDAETVVDLGTGVMDFAYAPDGTTIAAALVSGEVALVANGAEVLRVLAHDEAVNALAFSSDGSVLVTAGDDGLIKLWNVNALAQTTSALPTPLITLEGHTDVVTDLAISPDGMLLASISADNTLRLWAVVVQAVG
jgi:WD40 repeat protein